MSQEAEGIKRCPSIFHMPWDGPRSGASSKGSPRWGSLSGMGLGSFLVIDKLNLVLATQQEPSPALTRLPTRRTPIDVLLYNLEEPQQVIRHRKLNR